MKITSLLIMIVCVLFSIGGIAANLKVENQAQAVQLVKQQYQGKVLKVQSLLDDKYAGYRVKLLSDKGVIFYLQIDSKTGFISKK